MVVGLGTCSDKTLQCHHAPLKHTPELINVTSQKTVIISPKISSTELKTGANSLMKRFSVLLCKVNQSHYRPEVPRGFQEVLVPRLCDNGPEWW